MSISTRRQRDDARPRFVWKGNGIPDMGDTFETVAEDDGYVLADRGGFEEVHRATLGAVDRLNSSGEMVLGVNRGFRLSAPVFFVEDSGFSVHWDIEPRRLDGEFGVEAPMEVEFGEGIRFLGLNVSGSAPEGGGRIRIAYFWQASRTVSRDYAVLVHFTDESGNLVFQQDHEPVEGQKLTSTWTHGELVVESYSLRLPQDLDVYQIRVGLYDPSTGDRLPVLTHRASDGESRAVVGVLSPLS